MKQRIVHNSSGIATLEAIKIWSICGAQYIDNANMLEQIDLTLQRSISSFALNSRRALERLAKDDKFPLKISCWSRSGDISVDKIETDMWNSINIIIHSCEFETIFESLPNSKSYIESDNKVITFVKISTDKREDVYIDPFSIAYTYISDVKPFFDEKTKQSKLK